MSDAEGPGRADGDPPPRTRPWTRALGEREMPAAIELADGTYRHARTFQHSLFAATGAYDGPAGRVVLKLGCRQRVLGISLRGLGRWLTRRELAMVRRLADLEATPDAIAEWGDAGYVRSFLPGRPLRRAERVGDEFFPLLAALLEELVRRDVAYVDFNKPENVLVDERGRPALIDFQIAWHWPRERGDRRGWQRLVPHALGRRLLRRLQASDRYHLLKHWRRSRPDQLGPDELRAAKRPGFWIRLHRWVATPYRAVKRRLQGRR